MAQPASKSRPTTRGLTLLAVIALLACAAPGESREARRDARIGARLALASAGVIVGLLSQVAHQDASPAPESRSALDARAMARQPAAGPLARISAQGAAREGLLDLPPPTA